MRRERYWVCWTCKQIWHRHKGEPRKSCHKCHEPMVAARKYPMALRKQVQRERERQSKERARLEKKHSVCRTAFGSRLVVSKETKAAWKALVQAKQHRSFLKRANAFVEALREDIWSCPHYHGRTAEPRDCKCSGGGVVEAPVVVLTEGGSHILGTYNRTIMRGKYIEIAWGQGDRLATLIHECVHYIDDMSKAEGVKGCGSHTRSFLAREKDLSHQLRYRL